MEDPRDSIIAELENKIHYNQNDDAIAVIYGTTAADPIPRYYVLFRNEIPSTFKETDVMKARLVTFEKSDFSAESKVPLEDRKRASRILDAYGNIKNNHRHVIGATWSAIGPNNDACIEFNVRSKEIIPYGEKPYPTVLEHNGDYMPVKLVQKYAHRL